MAFTTAEEVIKFIADENIDLEVSEGEVWNTRRVQSLQALIDWNVVELFPEPE